MGVTSLGPHTRPACHQALRGMLLIKKNDFFHDQTCVCLFITPWGHVIQILPSDWSRQGHVNTLMTWHELMNANLMQRALIGYYPKFLAPDWLVLIGAMFTTLIGI